MFWDKMFWPRSRPVEVVRFQLDRLTLYRLNDQCERFESVFTKHQKRTFNMNASNVNQSNFKYESRDWFKEI